MKRQYLPMLILVIISITGACKPEVRDIKPAEWLEEMSIRELQQGYREGRFSVKEVVTAYIDRISAIDKNGPALNSIIIVNPDAIRIAEELDRKMASGKTQGILFGIPVVVKDNIDTGDKMPTTAGSNALRNTFAGNDSYIVKKLRDAGAVIIAKANLSEWANFRAMVSSSGWSAVGGQTKNPYVLDRNPCGSSSGSGVAVSANLCMAAIGTETDGSIVCPSNNNGIVGLKPTVGLLSRTGIIPISYTQDTPGPMCRSVEDAAICLGAMTGVDPLDPTTLESEDNYYTDYTEFLKTDGLKNKRIGLLKNSGGYSDRVDTLIVRAARDMAAAGARIIEVEAPLRREYSDAEFQVLLYEFKDGLNKYFEGRGEDISVKNIKDLIEFNIRDSVELKYFDQKILIEAEEKGDLNSGEYLEALEKMHKATRENGIDKLLKNNNLDVLIAPTGSAAWKTDLLLGDHFTGGNSSLAAVAGYPNITVPMGFIDNLPVGISFIGTAWSEPLLIEIAYSYEQATKHRKVPEYLATD